jgi:carboxymethylenebutenolidase
METRACWKELPGDGAPMSMYVAEPADSGTFPAILHFHTILGVNPQHQSMARRIASEGYVVVIPDLYYRLGKRMVFEPTPDRTSRMAAVGSLTDWGLTADTRSTLDYLKGYANVDNARIGVLGYCVGGRVAFLAACLHRDVKAAVIAYGTEITEAALSPKHPALPLDLAEGISGPMLHLSGSLDQISSPAHVESIAATLIDLGKQFEYEIYEGAGHAFFDEDIPERFNPVADAAGWERKLSFFKRFL